MSSKVIVIGAGFSGLSTAAYLAKAGFKVEIIEKNGMPGGRARKLDAAGFSFDMGPSWYWMPDIIEKFFADFQHKPSHYYDLVRLDPSYKVFFSDMESIEVPAKLKELYNLFESIEKGAARKLKNFLADAHRKYNLGMNYAAYKSGLSWFDFMDPKLLSGFLFTKSIKPLSKYIRSIFKDIRLIRILEFPAMFLGSTPSNTPSIYSLINYADLKLGTWYPMGGMFKIVEALEKICYEQGVEISYKVKVNQLDVLKNRVCGAHSGYRNFYADYFVSSADYQHTDQKLISDNYRNYSHQYWDSRILAPSALIFYIGVDKKIPNLCHHNLFFDTNFETHANEIYKTPKWPESPSIYVSASSITDPSVAPEGCENLVILIPVAPDLEDHGKIREYYFNMAISRIEKATGTPIRDHVIFHRSYAHSDFINDYNSYKGNAYGLANTLNQTGPYKPRIKNRRLSNLFYAGQLTVPGPGIPPGLISGKIVAQEVFKASGGHKS